ncbi:phage scaffolding protein [Metaclostridioides mangenotii]|uniref:Phage minor structural protein GP20 n=1 Tax=Metaclostridioides mangenotii TaxID=1540 RepID=A0ABS4E9R0_9FIRM|nr:phage scaffolding protein [Clostridioides mangenotii]MBP1854659.1 hypothetical protein [Clostridioides mangenotii]
MTKKELIELGLSEEDAKKVEEASTNELKSFIPKNSFDEVNNRKKQLETDVTERDKQLEDLKKNAGNTEELTMQIEKLQAENKVNNEKHEAEVKEIKISNAIEKSLAGAKAKNLKAVKALLDLENVDLLEDGTIKDLDKQIKTLKESEESNFLFNSDENNTNFKGFKPGEGNPNPTPKPMNEMNYAELCEYMETNNQQL